MGEGGKHLSLQLDTGRRGGIRGVSWNRGAEADALRAAGAVTAAVSLRENTWQGKTTLEFLAEGVRPKARLPLSVPAAAPRPFYRRSALAGQETCPSCP